MSRLVLDTNCLIQIVSPRSKFHSLWDSFVRGENTLCVSNEIIEEYVEIMQKLMGYAAAEYVIKTILNSKFTEMITPFYNFNLIEADKDDNKFVDCAIAAHAKCIVTNDHHYDVLKTIPFGSGEIVYPRTISPEPEAVCGYCIMITSGKGGVETRRNKVY